MARFLVRVELHDADEGENTYEHLHDEMENVGFLKTIFVDDEEKKLPPAEYIFKGEGSTSKEAVYKLAKDAAGKALKKAGVDTLPGIVVAEIVGSLYVGGLEDA
ncbi:hypothetical protein [Bdellovibrio sp. HCB-162]|uniref:hypothetical protein n=1 Tax=Bdellovibrio sp. HCB-162 TaxID=3394234 RepID=UPI0039BD6B5C